jgi:hypothetical protein
VGSLLTAQRYSLAETGELGREFAITHGLEEHAELFSNAAMVARDPTQFSSVDSLLPEQRAALEFERDHKWHGTGQLYFSMLVCALGAAVQGWDQTGSNGANLSFPVEFGLVPAPEPAASAARRALYWLVKRAGAVNTSGTPTKGDWIVGVINAAPYMSAAFPGTWLSDPLNHFLGRRGEIFREYQ